MNKMEKSKTWKDIFANFVGNKKVKEYSMKSLLILAGHLNSKSGSFTVDKWIAEMKKIKKKIYKKKGKLLEIGCGSGALLKYFSKSMRVFGVDYSRELLNIAKKAIPSGSFYFNEANKINFKNNFFDTVIMYSCIQYFPDKRYFNKVIQKIERCLKKNGNLYIGEIVDKDKLTKFEQYRIKQMSYSLYKKKYTGKINSKLKHFAISRKEIVSILSKNFLDIEIINSVKEEENRNFLGLM